MVKHVTHIYLQSKYKNKIVNATVMSSFPTDVLIQHNQVGKSRCGSPLKKFEQKNPAGDEDQRLQGNLLRTLIEEMYKTFMLLVLCLTDG